MITKAPGRAVHELTLSLADAGEVGIDQEDIVRWARQRRSSRAWLKGAINVQPFIRRS